MCVCVYRAKIHSQIKQYLTLTKREDPLYALTQLHQARSPGEGKLIIDRRAMNARELIDRVASVAKVNRRGKIHSEE